MIKPRSEKLNKLASIKQQLVGKRFEIMRETHLHLSTEEVRGGVKWPCPPPKDKACGAHNQSIGVSLFDINTLSFFLGLGDSFANPWRQDWRLDEVAHSFTLLIHFSIVLSVCVAVALANHLNQMCARHSSKAFCMEVRCIMAIDKLRDLFGSNRDIYVSQITETAAQELAVFKNIVGKEQSTSVQPFCLTTCSRSYLQFL